MDPLTASYPWYTPYQFAGNKPIWAVDLDGLEEREYTLLISDDKAELNLINEDFTRSAGITVYYMNSTESGSWFTNGRYKFNDHGFNSFGSKGQNKISDFYFFVSNHLDKDPEKVVKQWERDFSPNYMSNINGYIEAYKLGKSGGKSVVDAASKFVTEVGKEFIEKKPDKLQFKYSVIIKSFENMENAQRFVNENSSDFNGLQLLKGTNGSDEEVFRIATFTGESRGDAEFERAKLHATNNTDAWILTTRQKQERKKSAKDILKE